MQSNVRTFYADAVLFDMVCVCAIRGFKIVTLPQDGTLTDSIAAVEAAWGKVARDIGQDPAYVIAATHGKRAVDNLSQFKPSIQPHQMDAEVQSFEESILFFADAFRIHGPGSAIPSPPILSTPLSPISSGEATPDLVSPTNSLPPSRTSSFVALDSRRPSFASRLTGRLAMSALPEATIYDAYHFDSSILERDEEDMVTFQPDVKKQCLEAWQLEAASVDRSVRILPGVRKMIDSIPKGRYAVATSGAKTYGT